MNLALAAIGWMHRRAGRQPPQKTERGVVIADVMAGIRREHGRAPIRKAAADHDVLRAIDGDGLRALRDRALLALGFAAALRRSELVALEVGDVRRAPKGLRLRIRRSKTDQEGRGAEIAIPDGRRLQPVVHLEAWLARTAITAGPLFRRLSNDGRRMLDEPMSDRAVARLVQARVAAAGYDPAAFAGHSLRAGFLTSAARAGASVFKMRGVSRHKTVQLLADYVRDARLFDDHAGKDFL